MGFTWLTGLYYLAQKNILSNDCFAGYSCKRPSLGHTKVSAKFLELIGRTSLPGDYMDSNNRRD